MYVLTYRAMMMVPHFHTFVVQVFRRDLARRVRALPPGSDWRGEMVLELRIHAPVEMANSSIVAALI